MLLWCLALACPCRFTEADVSMIVTLLQACGLQLRAGGRGTVLCSRASFAACHPGTNPNRMAQARLRENSLCALGLLDGQSSQQLS